MFYWPKWCIYISLSVGRITRGVAAEGFLLKSVPVKLILEFAFRNLGIFIANLRNSTTVNWFMTDQRSAKLPDFTAQWIIELLV